MSFFIYFWGAIILLVGLFAVYLSVGKTREKIKNSVVENVKNRIAGEIQYSLFKGEIDSNIDFYLNVVFMIGVVLCLLGISMILGRVFG